MSINYYVGVEGVSIDIESAKEIWEALDILQTQVMDRFGDESPGVMILGRAMDEVVKKYDIDPYED